MGMLKGVCEAVSVGVLVGIGVGGNIKVKCMNERVWVRLMAGPRMRVGVRVSVTARLNCSGIGLRGVGAAMIVDGCTSRMHSNGGSLT